MMCVLQPSKRACATRRYLDGLTSERVDAAGVANIAETLKAVFKDRVSRHIFTCLMRLCKARFCKVPCMRLILGPYCDTVHRLAVLRHRKDVGSQQNSLERFLRCIPTPPLADTRARHAWKTSAHCCLQVAAREAATVLQMASEADLALWERLDDVIMGGQSSSTLRSAADIGGADFSGDLIVEGGGFCGARTKVCWTMTKRLPARDPGCAVSVILVLGIA